MLGEGRTDGKRWMVADRGCAIRNRNEKGAAFAGRPNPITGRKCQA